MTVFQPSDAAETAEVVAWAAAEGQPLEIVAGGASAGWVVLRAPIIGLKCRDWQELSTTIRRN